MPKLVTNANVIVIRDGKRVNPKLGKIFNYTADEVKTILAMAPLSLRKPINESEDLPVSRPPKPGSQKTIVEEDEDTAVDDEDEDEDDDTLVDTDEDDTDEDEDAAPTPKAAAKGKGKKAKPVKSEDDDI